MSSQGNAIRRKKDYAYGATRRVCTLFLTYCLPAFVSLSNAAVAQQERWEYAPYRVHVLLAFDELLATEGDLPESLRAYLAERVESAIGAMWRLEIQFTEGAQRHHVLADMEALAGDPSTEFPIDGDKLVLLAVRTVPDGFELAAREYDRYVQRWGAPLHRCVRQRAALAESTFALLRSVVAPLCQLEADAENESVVTLAPRGAALPQKAGWATIEPGDVYLPVLRRTTREGEPLPGGVQPAPWTYIEVIPAGDEQLVGRVLSGTRRPLGIRRRGRIEQVAIALRADPGESIIRFVSRTNPKKPLAGYEVFTQDAGAENIASLGLSDRDGRMTLGMNDPRQANGSRPRLVVQMLFVKNGNELLAKFPVVPGAEQELTVPLPDDDARLAAEARLAAVREEVVDVVARRNILMARVRQRIAAGDFKQAQELFAVLDQLPGRPQFAQQVENEARYSRADDPQVQKRIDQLVAGTNVVLGQYLDPKPIRQIQEELRAAQNKGDN